MDFDDGFDEAPAAYAPPVAERERADWLRLIRSRRVGPQTFHRLLAAYLNERLKAASWLIKSIQQRQQTIFRVTESIVKFQREFLDFGPDAGFDSISRR